MKNFIAKSILRLLFAVIGADISISRMELSLMNSLPNKLLFALLISVISPLLLYIYMKKNVIRPTEKISRAMQEFGKGGQYDVRPLELHCDNELGQIADSFNKMAVNTIPSSRWGAGALYD